MRGMNTHNDFLIRHRFILFEFVSLGRAMTRTLPVILATLLLASTAMTGCVPLVVAGGAAAAGGVAAGQEGGLKAAANDTAIRARISEAWYNYNEHAFEKVTMTVDQGRVLLTGLVDEPEFRVEAVRLAWQAKGVKQVINEIQVGGNQGFGSFAQDKWISSQFKTQLLFNKDIQSVNYSSDTVNGVVYLMGVAQNQKELNRVIMLARKIKGVKQVVSYVKLVGEPIISASPGSDGGRSSSSSGSSYSSSGAASSSSSYDTVPAGTPVTSPDSVQSEVLPP